ncbi:hypothetical protein TL16_g05677 [Triparma laevis f. inornata]|uniref:Uncharacterized protein n=1 Tax=Triparma laevis f. inornata TaxID=1714386 RepID=A0A9W7EAH6_9STRA|nr:hypothetical protein TL16_g05677 [Triparma laevis f. inornata]
MKSIVDLSSRSLPQRPDGVVLVAKYSSISRTECASAEAGYERLAKENPDTLFMRSYEEYEGFDALIATMDVRVLPTWDIYFKGNRVGRVEGSKEGELQGWITRYGYQNSNLDLFSDESTEKNPELAWGKGGRGNEAGEVKTTARFVPGYDWDREGSAFDDAAQKAEDMFTDAFENWTPNVDDD